MKLDYIMAFHVRYCFQKVHENNLFTDGKPCQSLKSLYEYVF